MQYRRNHAALKANRKFSYFQPLDHDSRRLNLLECTTKPIQEVKKKTPEKDLNSDLKTSVKFYDFTDPPSPCQMKPAKNSQSDFGGRNYRENSPEAEIRVKLDRNFKSSKMFIDYIDSKTSEEITYHLYYENEIMKNNNFLISYRKLEVDNDSATNDIQINLALDYIETQMREELGLGMPDDHKNSQS